MNDNSGEIKLEYPMIPVSFIYSLPAKELYLNLSDISKFSLKLTSWKKSQLDYLENQVQLIAKQLRQINENINQDENVSSMVDIKENNQALFSEHELKESADIMKKLEDNIRERLKNKMKIYLVK